MKSDRQAKSAQMPWEAARVNAKRREALLREGYALICLNDVPSEFDRIRARQIAEGQAAALRRQARQEEQFQNEHYRR